MSGILFFSQHIAVGCTCLHAVIQFEDLGGLKQFIIRGIVLKKNKAHRFPLAYQAERAAQRSMKRECSADGSELINAVNEILQVP